MMPIETIDHDQMMRDLLQNPTVREDWERTAFARAVANQVLRYRIEHDLSQRALAKRLGVSQALVGRLELGEHEPRISTLQKLSQILGLRFSIDIHPAEETPARLSTPDDDRVERATSGGVETIVLAS
jgi:transcriptional regulator with XRE-family HTH domain